MIVNGFSRMLVNAFARSVRAMKRDKRGNAAITFGLMAVPLIAIVGLGVDYYRELSTKARLDSAADAAALAAINTMQAYLLANSQTQTAATLTSNAETAGQTQAYSVFKANAGTAETVAPVTPSVTLGPDATSPLMIDATVTYSAQMPAVFGGLVGVNTLNVNGSSRSSLTMGAYEDFYLVLDVSGSMGLPTATTDQQTLANSNPDNQYYRTWNPATKSYTGEYPSGCMFACHFQSTIGDGLVAYQGFTYAETNNLKLRVDSLASAVLALMNYANTPGVAMFPNQYRLGVYPFIQDAVQAVQLATMPSAGSETYAMFTPTPSGTSNLYTTPFAATYLDSGTSLGGSGTIGSGGTHFESLWKDMKNYLLGSGSGAISAPHGFIFLVTDGVDNSQVFNAITSWYPYSVPQLPSPSADPSFCANAKNANYTVAVLLIPYVPINPPNPDFGDDEDDVVNAIATPDPSTGQSKIETTMQNCASPGFYVKANTDQDITNAILSLFTLAKGQARLTQ